MILLKADHDRKLEIPGVPGLVQRPVDIDQSQTGFKSLRTLRIYRFDPHSVINGHAEEDEVFIIALKGSIDLTMSTPHGQGTALHFTLAAGSDSPHAACAAYLPPHATYRLIPRSDADIAYVRATPVSSRPPRVFNPPVPGESTAGVTELLDEAEYAQRLRLRLLQVSAQRTEIAIMPIRESERTCEALLHIRSMPAQRVATLTQSGAAPLVLDSWDTVSITPGENPTLRIATESSVLALIAEAV